MPRRILARVLCPALLLLATTSAHAQQLDVPFNTYCPPNSQAACFGVATVMGLNPNGDGFLAVRTGPGSNYRKIGEVDFGEFVAVVWNFCTYTPYTLVSLIFDMYDDDGSGSLDFAEVQKLVRELYGIQSGIDEPRLLAALESLSGGGIFDRSRPIHRDRFETFAIEHPAVVRPALDMQADVRPDAPSPGATKRQSAP